MNRKTAYRADWVEGLENRQMFSASSLVQMVGTYTGTTRDSNEKSPGTQTTVIQSETHTGKITGYTETKFPHEHTHVSYFTGKITGNSILVTTATTTIKCKISDSGHVLVGSYAFASSDDSSTGSFSLTRVGK